MNKTALIIGIGGQDGSYLAQFLLGKGYRVVGASRDSERSSFGNLKTLGIYSEVEYISLSVVDFRSTLQALVSINPDEIYNLAGQTSVGLSFQQPVETLESIATGTLNILEAIRFLDKPIRFYNAGSSECFGDTGEKIADESTPFHPKSPYGVAKSAAFWEVANYRESYGIHACTGILSNHESPLRHPRFVTRKIILSVCDIAHKKTSTLKLGNIHIKRDWGWAPEYVQAMWRMLQQESPDDFLIATGVTHSLEEFIAYAFGYFDLDYKNHLQVDSTLMRPSDIATQHLNPAKAKRILDWKADTHLQSIIQKMIEHEQHTHRP